MSTSQKILITTVILILSLTFLYFYRHSYQTPKVVFLDVGQGDAIFIRTKAGENILIDGGPDKTVLEKLGKYLPFYERNLDLIILTHPHADHATGLVEVLKRYQVKKVILTGVVHAAPAYLEFLKVLKNKNTETINSANTTQLDFNDLSLEILYPWDSLSGQAVDDLNNSSIVIMIESRPLCQPSETGCGISLQKILLTGDIGLEVEKQILEKFGSDKLKADILKVGHQGSTTSSGQEFLKAVSPSQAVISVGENKFGHPSPRVINRLQRLGAQVLRTDGMGDIFFTLLPPPR